MNPPRPHRTALARQKWFAGLMADAPEPEPVPEWAGPLQWPPVAIVAPPPKPCLPPGSHLEVRQLCGIWCGFLALRGQMVEVVGGTSAEVLQKIDMAVKAAHPAARIVRV